MKIVILQGSPNKQGSTSLLCGEFIRGANEAGHNTQLFDVAAMNIHPCVGCLACKYNGPCVQKDGYQPLREAICDADMLVFATPLYFYGMSTQLKAVIDRMCAYVPAVRSRHMKAALLSVAYDAEQQSFEALYSHYQTLVKYLGMEDLGTVLGKGCGTPKVTKDSPYMAEAYNLGKEI